MNDFFPLSVGSMWRYTYASDEKSFVEFFLAQRIIDSGRVEFQVMSTTSTDSSREWTIKERDNIIRHELDYQAPSTVITKDTTYPRVFVSTFALHEAIDSTHMLTGSSALGIWQFPMSWYLYGFATGSPVFRYSSDSAERIVSDRIQATGPAIYSDTMLFREDVGLVEVRSHIAKGPITLYYLDWKAVLFDYALDVKENNYVSLSSPLLLQNYPNPFNPSTTIRYAIPHRDHVTLSVYNTLGQRVTTLVSAIQDPGYHDVRFDARGLADGVYFCRLRAGGYLETKKLLLVR